MCEKLSGSPYFGVYMELFKKGVHLCIKRNASFIKNLLKRKQYLKMVCFLDIQLIENIKKLKSKQREKYYKDRNIWFIRLRRGKKRKRGGLHSNRS